MGGQVSRNQRPSSDLPFSYTCESSNAFAIRQGEEDREREGGTRLANIYHCLAETVRPYSSGMQCILRPGHRIHSEATCRRCLIYDAI